MRTPTALLAAGASWLALQHAATCHDCDPWCLVENPSFSRAILNVEWRDATETLIAFESYDLLDAASPTDCR